MPLIKRLPEVDLAISTHFDPTQSIAVIKANEIASQARKPVIGHGCAHPEDSRWPAVLGYDFRPFFLLAPIHTTLAIPALLRIPKSEPPSLSPRIRSIFTA